MSRKHADIDTKTPEMIVIGDYLFLPETGELRGNDGETTVLRSQSADVLARLAAHPNEIVPEDSLTEAAGSQTAVTDDSLASLAQCIDDIRRALRDADHKLIEHFPEAGYRLNAQPVAETVREQVPHGPPPPPGTQGQRTTRRGLMAVFFVLLLLALVLYIILWPGLRARSDAGGTFRVAALAVEAPGTGAETAGAHQVLHDERLRRAGMTD